MCVCVCVCVCVFVHLTFAKSTGCDFIRWSKLVNRTVCPMQFRMKSIITGYGSTLYIGIAMVFVFSPYIWKFSSYFQFQVILTFNDFTAQHMSKQSCMLNISLKTTFRQSYK